MNLDELEFVSAERRHFRLLLEVDAEHAAAVIGEVTSRHGVELVGIALPGEDTVSECSVEGPFRFEEVQP